MKLDILIKNGHVIDTASGVDSIKNIGVKNGRIVEVDNEESIEATRTLDASSYIVTPGLIDSHVHVFDKGCDLGIPADVVMIPNGVTTIGEGGSCGISNYRSFLTMSYPIRVRFKMLINVSPTGLSTFSYPETIRPETWNLDQFKRAFDLNGTKLMGLKLRISDEVVGKNGFEILKASLNLAEQLNTRLVVHVTDTSMDQAKLVNLLRKDDIYCHVYQGYGETILSKDGKVLDAFYEAKQRGVIMDAASGKNNFSFHVAELALREGFMPDVICSDVSSMNFLAEYIENGLPYIMSKFLALGMNLQDIVKRTTEIPAKIMGMEQEVGSLRPGSLADLSIFQLKNGTYSFIDAKKEKLYGEQMLVPMATIHNGDLLYKNIEF